MSHNIELSIALEKKYPIRVGQEMITAIRSFCRQQYDSGKAIAVVDEKVLTLHEEKIREIFTPCFENIQLLTVPEGEASKSVAQWQRLVDEILQRGAERGTPLVAIGGGVTGDLAGFVAASTLRGLPLLHMPTSLLAMVDSSIGGKTGVNHATGKNLIGAFYQPDAIFADVDFLHTLEQEEWITGLAEILKYGAISKPNLFNRLVGLLQKPLEPNDQWSEIISVSARTKAEIVREDALEAGKRAFLNFGHTFGHALEKVAGYGNISHGEAVFAGMIAAVDFSRRLGYPVDDIRFDPFLPLYRQQIGHLPNDTEALVEAMKTDKKVKNDTLQLVLLKEWGSPYIQPCTDYPMLRDTWEYTLSQFT